MVRVAKFGGSSVASAEQFRKVKNIVDLDDSRRFVVVSAVGKADKDDNKFDYSQMIPPSFEPSDDVTLLEGGCVKSKNQVFFDILYKKDFISLLC